MAPQDRALTWVLRAFGVIDLLSLLAVAAPRVWLDWGSRLTETGPLPDTPLVNYLVRTGCAMYALHGATVLFLSFDIARYRPLIRFLGIVAIAHGGLVGAIDWVAGMPLWWRWLEGPAFSMTGIIVLALCRRERGGATT